MIDHNAETPLPKLVLPVKTAWMENRPLKKDGAFYLNQRTKYEESFRENEFLTIPEALDAVSTCTISLLTSDVKTRKLIGVSRETMEEALKALNISLQGPGM